MLIGCAGDDVLIYHENDPLRVGGGSGLDTLRLQNGDDINFTQLCDLLALSDSSNDLYIVGEVGDAVNLGAGFSATSIEVNGTDGAFNVYCFADASNDARLFAEMDVQLNFEFNI